MPSPLELIFTADLSGVSRATREAEERVRLSFSEMSRSAKAAEGALQSFSREQRMQDRALGFYGQQIGALSGAFTGNRAAARLASEGVATLGGTLMDLATGSWVGAITGALSLGVIAWKEFGGAGDEAAEKAKTKLRSLIEILDEYNAKQAKANFLKAGGTEEQYDVSQSETAKRIADLKELLARAEIAKVSEIGEIDPRRVEATLKHLEGRIRDARGQLLRGYQETGTAYGLDAANNPITIDAFRGLGGMGARSTITPEEVEAFDRGKKAAAEAGKATAKAWAESFKQALDDSNIATQIDKAIAGRARYAAEYGRPEMDRSGFGSSRLGQGAAGEAALNAMTARTRTPEEQAQSKALDKAIADHQKRVEDLRKSYQSFARDAMAGIAGVITGHEKIGDVTRRLGAEAIQIAAKWAIAQITNASAVGGANAAASSAEAGPAGIIAAPAVMATMISMIAALLSSVVSAEGGGDFSNIPLGRAFAMVGHGGEIMIPAPIASYVRKAAERDAQGRGGEPRVSTTLRVVGRAGSFYDMAIEGGRDLARAMVTLRRQGVL